MPKGEGGVKASHIPDFQTIDNGKPKLCAPRRPYGMNNLSIKGSTIKVLHVYIGHLNLPRLIRAFGQITGF